MSLISHMSFKKPLGNAPDLQNRTEQTGPAQQGFPTGLRKMGFLKCLMGIQSKWVVN